jgi:hypothetical protein
MFICLLYSAAICVKGFEMHESNISFKVDSSPSTQNISAKLSSGFQRKRKYVIGKMTLLNKHY